MAKRTRRMKEPEFHYFSKEQALRLLKSTTKRIKEEGTLIYLKKLGFTEVPLEEVQDRLTKIRRPLSDEIVTVREVS
jgi:hypothetical protein